VLNSVHAEFVPVNVLKSVHVEFAPAFTCLVLVVSWIIIKGLLVKDCIIFLLIWILWVILMLLVILLIAVLLHVIVLLLIVIWWHVVRSKMFFFNLVLGQGQSHNLYSMLLYEDSTFLCEIGTVCTKLIVMPYHDHPTIYITKKIYFSWKDEAYWSGLLVYRRHGDATSDTLFNTFSC